MRQLTGQDENFLELETLGLPQRPTSVTIFDHCVMDGVSTAEMMAALLELSPTPRLVEPEPPVLAYA